MILRSSRFSIICFEALAIMSQPPSTPVKVPSAAANYTPATLDPDLRSQINTTLLRDGHVPRYDMCFQGPSSFVY